MRANNRDDAIERTFEALALAAAKGERCPIAPHIPADHVAQLARSGRIMIEIHGRNFRVVTIMAGPHAGKSTAPPPTSPNPAYRNVYGAGAPPVSTSYGLQITAKALKRSHELRAGRAQSRLGRMVDRDSERAAVLKRLIEMHTRIAAVAKEYGE